MILKGFDLFYGAIFFPDFVEKKMERWTVGVVERRNILYSDTPTILLSQT